MALLTMAQILKHAKANHYAVPAFNTWDAASFVAAQMAAEEEDAPIILAAGDSGTVLGGPTSELWAACALTTAKQSTMPMAVHVDHGKSFESCMRGIRLGFTSVMIDASTLPFAENVAATKKVVDAAHAMGVTVEAELGHVGQGTDVVTDEVRTRTFTRPDEAVKFVAETGVDALAIAVGTQHGIYAYEPILDFPRLQELNERVPAYLVIHGGSGTPGLEKVAKMGVTKINIATEVMQACLLQMRPEIAKEVAHPGVALRGATGAEIAAAKAQMIERIRCFGASGQGKALLKSLL